MQIIRMPILYQQKNSETSEKAEAVAYVNCLLCGLLFVTDIRGLWAHTFFQRFQCVRRWKLTMSAREGMTGDARVCSLRITGNCHRTVSSLCKH